MQKNRVCILAAGRGTRLGDYTKVFNKAMLPLGGKAIISHIIENFPEGSHFVIALGYKGEALQGYIELAHPGLNVTFVNVKDFDGPTSGPGASLLTCKEALGPDAFYFVTCDTYWTKSVSTVATDRSWIALDLVQKDKTAHYCTVETEGDLVTGLRLKQLSAEPQKPAFTGLAFVKDTEIFWDALEKSEMALGEKQVIEAFHELARSRLLYSTFIDWVDTGLTENYQNELKKYGSFDFSKVKEALYIFSGRIIKYFDNDQDSLQRAERAALNPKVFPKITGQKKHMFRYEFHPGKTLYEDDRPEVFKNLLPWLDRQLWMPVHADPEGVRKLCDLFYREKTYSRIDQFKKKYPDYNITQINGEPVPSADELLQKLPWEEFEKGVPCFIHGDLQPDNILYDSEQNKFILLDWRQNFAGEVAYGDLYYDFAKLWGGLNLNYKEVKNNAFSYSEAGTSCTYKFPQHRHFESLTEKLEKLARQKNLSVGKIHLLVGIIYLNMSPLHHYPFDKMLYALGRKVLFETHKQLP